MCNSIEEIKEVLYYAQEIDNQTLINTCAEELAFKRLEQNPRLDYKELLFQLFLEETKKTVNPFF